ALSFGAIALMLMLCVTWGFNQIAIKLVLQEIPPYLQALLRSAMALPVILIIAAVRGTPMFARDGSLKAGLLCGLAFSVQFILMYQALEFTTASRAVVFVYTMPFFVALGAYQFLGERLRLAQWIGLAVSFIGVAVAIGAPQADVDAKVILGDVMIVISSMLWASTTLSIKGTALGRCPPEKALAYQVAVSIPILGLATLLSSEGLERAPSLLTWSVLASQGIWVVGMTFMMWVALVKIYSASKLSAFTFIVPLIGVIGGYLIMHDPIGPAFAVAAVLVIAGLYLVNKPAPPPAPVV
ncbi:MAG: Permease of the drug/metabolite transporter superfamily, partial [Tardiphaga sp.]|nr:Permease of the drug/metabolite transporter superfamily [Tardiphaga sp.]